MRSHLERLPVFPNTTQQGANEERYGQFPSLSLEQPIEEQTRCDQDNFPVCPGKITKELGILLRIS